jgi:CxxC-x17-CxxC domain-containing protein
MAFQERTLTCVDCGQSFPFTVEDQTYHADKGFTNDPKRCSACRSARRSDREGGSGYSSYSSAPREMFPVVCAQCGKNTEVPFKPTSDKPVYCSDCYSRRQDSGSSGRYRSR